MRKLAPILIVVAACGQNPYEAKVDGIVLADAEGSVPAEAGPVVKLTLDDLEPEIPDAPVARLAIGVDVSWGRVKTTIAAMRAKGVRPVLLAGRRDEVRAIVLSDALDGKSIHLTATPDGKFCVGPPTTNEAKCVQGADKKHIQRGFLRELVRDAVKAYDLHDVDAMVNDEMWWADVVKTVDGARTCCGDAVVRVKLMDDPTL